MTMQIDGEEYLTTKGYANKFGVSIKTVQQLVYRKLLIPKRIEGRLYIKADTPYPRKRRPQYHARPNVTNKLNTLPVIADITGVTYSTLYTWARAKKIPSIKIDKVLYSTVDAVLCHMNQIRTYRQAYHFVKYYSHFADIADEHVYDSTRDGLSFLYLTKAEHSHSRRSCLEQVRKMEVI